MFHLPNKEKLTHPDRVNELIRQADPQSCSGKGFLIIEAVTGELVEYSRGHIPGAICLDTNTFERAPLWNVVADDDLEQALIAHGITHEKTVLLYSRIPFAAARTALVLMYAGVSDVRLLGGGIEAWSASGYELEAGAREPAPAEEFGLDIPVHPEYILKIGQVQDLLSDQNAVLACARTWEEHIGETSGYDYIQPKGRIPGSTWAGHPLLSAHNEEQNYRITPAVRRFQKIASVWRERGITPDKRVAFYCGTGWRASLAFFYAHLMGWKEICVYDGGWLEWSSRPENPIEVGISG
jgi:thiosulfate/3-mercaptopyruvate sulfurtransferase